MLHVFLDVLIAALAGTLAAGVIAALAAPLVPDGEFGPLLAGFILLCIGLAFVLVRRRRMRLERQS